MKENVRGELTERNSQMQESNINAKQYLINLIIDIMIKVKHT